VQNEIRIAPASNDAWLVVEEQPQATIGAPLDDKKQALIALRGPVHDVVHRTRSDLAPALDLVPALGPPFAGASVGSCNFVRL
jgi:hypothetical protein